MLGYDVTVQNILTAVLNEQSYSQKLTHLLRNLLGQSKLFCEKPDWTEKYIEVATCFYCSRNCCSIYFWVI